MNTELTIPIANGLIIKFPPMELWPYQRSYSFTHSYPCQLKIIHYHSESIIAISICCVCVLVIPIFIHDINLNYSKKMTITLGSSLKNNCRKGQNCNFLHIFKNPSDLFSIERTLRESTSVMNSQRNRSVRNDNKDEYVIEFPF